MSAPALHTTTGNISEAARLVAAHYDGERGVWIYRAFDWINETLFHSKLPWPRIILAITPHGACLGRTHNCVAPTITLHPSLWGGTETKTPWGIPSDLLGARCAFDVLIHECIHVSVYYLLGGADGPTSHDNPQWISEVNRIAPLIGLPGLEAGRNRPTRVGKATIRKQQGNVPFTAVARFPFAVRLVKGQIHYYRDRSALPFE